MSDFVRRWKRWARLRCRDVLGLPAGGVDVLSDLHRAAGVRAAWLTAEFIEQNMAAARPLDTRYAVLDHALDVLAKVPGVAGGLYCEFGVYKGETLNHIARKVDGMVHGFDSFEGLPECWRDGYPQGAFRLAAGQLPVCEPNVNLVAGWFDESLPRFLETRSDPVAFIHVDCDLYSSTRTIFEHLGGRIMPGAVLVFDEYFNYIGWRAHEHRAFEEFLVASGKRCDYLCYNKFDQQVAVQIW